MDELVRFLEEMLLKYGDNIDFSTFPIKEENLYTDEYLLVFFSKKS